MSLHVECLLLEAESALMQEEHRAYLACRHAGDSAGAAEHLVRTLQTATRALRMSEAVLTQLAIAGGSSGNGRPSRDPSSDRG